MIILAAGGTGGHVSPALAIAEALEKAGKPFHFVADQRTAKMIPENYPQTILQIPPPSAGRKQQLKAMRVTTKQLLPLAKQAEKIICFGGYPAFPAGIAAILKKKPLILHEQNAVMGRSNRLLTPFAKVVALSFKDTLFAPKKKSVITGNPVRGTISPVPYPLVDGTIQLLVTGGSLGATIFSEVVPAAFKTMSLPNRQRFHITQQCRAEDIEAVQEAYKDMEISATLKSFFDNLPQQIANAHLIICRAGASTLAEVLTIGRPGILVPYPYAAHNHQTLNAKAVIAQDSNFRLIQQPEFTAESLAEYLLSMANNIQNYKPLNIDTKPATEEFMHLL